MHIAVLTHNYPRFPGDFSGNFVAALNHKLAQQGARVSVLAPWDAAYPAPLPNNGNPSLHLWRYAPRADWHRLGYMRTMEADVRMRQNTYALAPLFFAAGAAATLRWCRRARPDLLHAHWVLPNGFFAALASRALGIPLVVSIPGSDALVAGQNPLFRSMARFALRQADLVTANSAALRHVAMEALGADPNRFDLIIYGVDPTTLRPSPQGVAERRASWGVPKDALLLLAVGRMVYKKGFDVLLRALGWLHAAGLLTGATPGVPPIHLALVGDGDLWDDWRQLSHALRLDAHVHWLGRVPFDQMGEVYNAADALVMPSVTRPADGLNVCVLDAMACAKPVIGSTAAGNDLVIRPGVNGLLTPEQDEAALAQAILDLAVLPALARAAMGAASRRLVETEFGWPHLARRYLDHFEALKVASDISKRKNP